LDGSTELSRIGRAIVHMGHEKFLTHPATQNAITALSWLVPIGEGFTLISNIIRTGAKLITKQAVKGGLTNPQLVQKSATLAERAIGGTGNVAGTLKHTYAKKLLSRYQSRFGGNLSLGSNYFNNGIGNRGFLDVVNHSTKTIYDFKFGSAAMSNAQYLKYSRNFEGYGINIITP
jgi:hypothetical protein